VNVAEDAENQLDREDDKWRGVGMCQWS